MSAAIMLTVTGAIFSLMNPAQGTSQAQTEVADVQQRHARRLGRAVQRAGHGRRRDLSGSTTGSLINFFAPILPRRSGASDPMPPTVFRPDAITMTYIPNTLLADDDPSGRCRRSRRS